MGSRPLTDEERASIQERLIDAKRHSQILVGYIASMEKELEEGTTWYQTPEESAKMQKEVKEIARKDQERHDQWEIKRYGRVLTNAERLGWVHMPKEVGNDNQP